MHQREGRGADRAVAACPACGAQVDVTNQAAMHVASLGMWEGLEDCFTCSTVLWFNVTRGTEGGLFTTCKQF